MSLIRRTRFLVALSWLGLGLAPATLLQASPPDSESAPRLAITGTLTYTARIALPPDGLAIIELSDMSVPGGRLIAEQRIALEGRQVPIAFELAVERTELSETQPYSVSGTILSGGLIAWAAEPVTIEPGMLDIEHGLDLGTVMLNRHDPVAPATAFLCGDQPIRVGFAHDGMRLEIGNQSFDLRQALSGSGARYVALDDDATSFWSKGDRGMLTVAGTSYPECVPVKPAQTAFRATGNEPSWVLKMDDTRVELNADLGETWIEVALTEPELIQDGRRYGNLIEDGTLTISILDRHCVDTMSGMPHPKTVEIILDERTLHGCGGEPAELLQGPEWVVEDIERGGIIDRSRVTLIFGADGQFSGRASCNSYLGDYRLTGESLTLVPSATTRMACAPALMNQEERFLDLLKRVQRFELDPTGALVLLTNDGGSLLARREGSAR